MIKLIGVKCFDYFEDRRTFIDTSADKIIGNILVMLKGEKWRQLRATMSPAFTGSKMRLIFELIANCSGAKFNWEMKDFFSRYANYVVATCAFGVEINSIENLDNYFYLAGNRNNQYTKFQNHAETRHFLDRR